jgi:ribonuclease Z
MELSLFFAGTGGSLPTQRRGMPGILIRRGGEDILVDCGEGTQRQLLRSVGLADLDEIFITHLHADHWLGLPGMLKTFDLRSREAPLRLYGPRGIQDLVDGFLKYVGRTEYPLYVTELQDGELQERDGYDILPVAVSHRGAALGYVFHELDRPGVFDPARAASLGLTPGPDFGRVQRGETVDGVSPEQVMGPTRAGRKFTFSGDTRPSDALREAAHLSDVLIHESTFAIEEAERAHLTGHSTAAQAAGVARDAEVKLLALNHISIRYPARLLKEEAREIFANTVVPHDFDTIEIPFPERGDPTLVRWSERQAAAAVLHDSSAEEPAPQDAQPEDAAGADSVS